MSIEHNPLKKYSDKNNSLLNFKSPVLKQSEPENPDQCPNTGPPPFPNAEYVRKCLARPNLCSCNIWDKPDVWRICIDAPKEQV